jgi:hypothetical protein
MVKGRGGLAEWAKDPIGEHKVGGILGEVVESRGRAIEGGGGGGGGGRMADRGEE